MAALVRAFSHSTGIETGADLKMVAIFCGAGLFVSLLVATYGLDLSPGFF